MSRWMKIAAIFLCTLAFIVLGVGVGLLLIGNDRWEGIELHPWLRRVFGDTPWEVWMPTLIAGWLVAFLAMAVLFLWSVFYVWRRRQYETELRRLERQLIRLRNLPFEEPAPFEDEYETPNPTAARLLARIERDHAAGGSGTREP